MKIRSLITIILVLIIIVGGYFFIVKKDITPEEIPKTIENTPINTTPISNLTETPNVTVRAKTNATIKCELCHTNPENIDQHVNGGKLCQSCHGSQVHYIHTGPGTVNLDCNTCHGIPPKIPVVAKGTGPGHYIVCENCHAPPPNSLNSSLGNLIVIHLSRGKYCTNCHSMDIGKIHEAALNKSFNKSKVDNIE